MATFTPTHDVETDAMAGAAEASAQSNWAANCSALSQSQPLLPAALAGRLPDVRPVFARDGSLAALGPDGKWWRHCSVPLCAAEAMLESLDVKGRVVCLLRPPLATHVRVALRRSRPDQAVVAVVPDLDDLCVMLHCDDFSADLDGHRLWFAWGEQWPDEMTRLFDERPSLATPAQFIRLPVTSAEDVETTVAAAQAVFSAANASRGAKLAQRRDAWHSGRSARRRLCVVAPGQFRLWDDAGAVLRDMLARLDGAGDFDVTAFDPDDPAQSAGSALLAVAEKCDAVAAADLARVNLPGLLPIEMPVITWVTRRNRLPAFASAGPHDVLVVADAAWRSHAVDAGWPPERLRVGGWPSVGDHAATSAPTPPVLAVVADTRVVEMPGALTEFSSHEMLWRHTEAELARDPFALGDDPDVYLAQQMRRHGVAREGFDMAMFLERLLLPAYQQGIVRGLVRAGSAVRVWGKGWAEIGEFGAVYAGDVDSQSDLLRVRAQAAALVHMWPGSGVHPVGRLGRPVVRPAGGGLRAFIDAARRALSAPGSTPAPAAPPITADQFTA